MTQVLLDTHVVIWFLNGDDFLSGKAKSLILDSNIRKFVSIASLWETAIKICIGKLKFSGGIVAFLALLEMNGIELLPIKCEYIAAVENLELIHRDPFDRILIATAMTENMPIISADRYFGEYRVRCIW